MTGKQGKENWRIRDERGAVRTLQRAWPVVEHEAAICLSAMTNFSCGYGCARRAAATPTST